MNHGVKFVDDKAIVVVQCHGCQKGFEVVVPFKGYRAWIEGVNIQNAMPTVGRDERELLISGTCGKCWGEMSPPEEEEEKEPVSLLTPEERESLGLNGATLVASEVIEPPAPKSWAPEVIADASGKWTGNGLRFARKEDAEKWVEGLRYRWTLVRETRVVPSEDAPNQQGELHSPHRVQL